MRRVAVLLACAFACVLALGLFGCGAGSGSTGASASASASPVGSDSAASTSAPSTSGSSSSAGAELAEGRYDARFNTDSSMFHVNEADGGLGVLTVGEDGMSIHIRLVSKRIVSLYAGSADEAAEDAANVIEPTTESVTYDDGYQEEVYAFDVPVPAIDEDFAVAVLGEKGTWYDHTVSVSDPQQK